MTPQKLKWTDSLDIAIELYEKFQRPTRSTSVLLIYIAG